MNYFNIYINDYDMKRARHRQKPIFQHLCLVLLRGKYNFCLGQKHICPGQNLFVLDKKVCPRLKTHDQSFCTTKKFGSKLKIPFLHGKTYFKGLFKSKSGLFSHGQNFFVMDNLGFVQDKNYFVHAEGRGITLEKLEKLIFQKVISKFFYRTFRDCFLESS